MKWATAFIALRAVARFAGSDMFLFRDPGVALAKPRSTPGFMLTPASQAKTFLRASQAKTFCALRRLRRFCALRRLRAYSAERHSANLSAKTETLGSRSIVM